MNELPTTLLQTLPKFQSVPNLGFSFDVLLGGEPVEIGVIPGGERRRGGACGWIVYVFFSLFISEEYLFFFSFFNWFLLVLLPVQKNEIQNYLGAFSPGGSTADGKVQPKTGTVTRNGEKDWPGKSLRCRRILGVNQEGEGDARPNWRWMRDFGGIFGT